jgi:hypothetical protein
LRSSLRVRRALRVSGGAGDRSAKLCSSRRSETLAS